MAVQDTGVKFYNSSDNSFLFNYDAGGIKPRKVVFSRCGKFIGIGY